MGNKIVLGKNKVISELPLYRSFTMFMIFIKSVIVNLQKDIKITYGYTILNNTTEIIQYIKKSYNEKSTDLKISYIEKVYDIIGDIDLYFKMLFELKLISTMQISRISLYIGEIIDQLLKWKRFIKKEHVKENDAKET